MKKSLILILTVAILSCPAVAHAATLQLTPGGILTGATGVVINGSLYDVQFHDGTITSVFGSTNPVDFDFQSGTDASAAASALIDQVFVNILANEFDTEPDTVFGISDEADSKFYIPYGYSTLADIGHPFSINAVARNHEQEFLDSALSEIILNESSNTAIPFNEETLFNGGETAWARFTLVPEPSSLAMLGFGGLALARRRRD